MYEMRRIKRKNDFKKRRRKCTVSLKPTSPIKLKPCSVFKWLRTFLKSWLNIHFILGKFKNPFRQDKFKTNITNNIQDIKINVPTIPQVKIKNIHSKTNTSQIIEEITKNFFAQDLFSIEGQKKVHNSDLNNSYNKKVKSDTSIPNVKYFGDTVNQPTVIVLRGSTKRRLKKSKFNIKRNPVGDLIQVTDSSPRQYHSATTLLKTDFFALSKMPQYSIYPLEINTKDNFQDNCNVITKSNNNSAHSLSNMALENMNDANTKCENLKQKVETSTKGEKCNNNMCTQFVDVTSQLCKFGHPNIKQQIAQYFEILPNPEVENMVEQNTLIEKQLLDNIDTETITNQGKSELVNIYGKVLQKSTLNENKDYIIKDKEALFLFTGSPKNQSSEESNASIDLYEHDDDINSSDKCSGKHQVLNCNSFDKLKEVGCNDCSTNTTEMCVCSEMYPKFKEWYTLLEQSMTNAHENCLADETKKKHSANNINKNTKLTLSWSDHKQEKKDEKNEVSFTTKKTKMDVDKLMSNEQECNTFLSMKPSLESDRENRNVFEILSHRYPSFIGIHDDKKTNDLKSNKEISSKKKEIVKYSLKTNSSTVKKKGNNYQKEILNKEHMFLTIGKNNAKIQITAHASVDNSKSIEVGNHKSSLGTNENQNVSKTNVSYDFVKSNFHSQLLLNVEPEINFSESSDNKLNEFKKDKKYVFYDIEKMVEELLKDIPSSNKLNDQSNKLNKISEQEIKIQHQWSLEDMQSKKATVINNECSADIELQPLYPEVMKSLYNKTVLQIVPTQTIMPILQGNVRENESHQRQRLTKFINKIKGRSKPAHKAMDKAQPSVIVSERPKSALVNSKENKDLVQIPRRSKIPRAKKLSVKSISEKKLEKSKTFTAKSTCKCDKEILVGANEFAKTTSENLNASEVKDNGILAPKTMSDGAINEPELTVQSVLSSKTNSESVINESPKSSSNSNHSGKTSLTEFKSKPSISSKSSSTRQSVGSFIKSLLLCLRYTNSEISTDQQGMSVKSDDISRDKAEIKSKQINDSKTNGINKEDSAAESTFSTYSTEVIHIPSSRVESENSLEETQDNSLEKQNNKIANNYKSLSTETKQLDSIGNKSLQKAKNRTTKEEPTNSVAIQVYMAPTNVQDKNISSSTLTRHKKSKGSSRAASSQTSRDVSMNTTTARHGSRPKNNCNNSYCEFNIATRSGNKHNKLTNPTKKKHVMNGDIQNGTNYRYIQNKLLKFQSILFSKRIKHFIFNGLRFVCNKEKKNNSTEKNSTTLLMNIRPSLSVSAISTKISLNSEESVLCDPLSLKFYNTRSKSSSIIYNKNRTYPKERKSLSEIRINCKNSVHSREFILPEINYPSNDQPNTEFVLGDHLNVTSKSKTIEVLFEPASQLMHTNKISDDYNSNTISDISTDGSKSISLKSEKFLSSMSLELWFTNKENIHVETKYSKKLNKDKQVTSDTFINIMNSSLNKISQKEMLCIKPTHSALLSRNNFNFYNKQIKPVLKQLKKVSKYKNDLQCPKTISKEKNIALSCHLISTDYENIFSIHLNTKKCFKDSLNSEMYFVQGKNNEIKTMKNELIQTSKRKKIIGQNTSTNYSNNSFIHDTILPDDKLVQMPNNNNAVDITDTLAKNRKSNTKYKSVKPKSKLVQTTTDVKGVTKHKKPDLTNKHLHPETSTNINQKENNISSIENDLNNRDRITGKTFSNSRNITSSNRQAFKNKQLESILNKEISSADFTNYRKNKTQHKYIKKSDSDLGVSDNYSTENKKDSELWLEDPISQDITISKEHSSIKDKNNVNKSNKPILAQIDSSFTDTTKSEDTNNTLLKTSKSTREKIVNLEDTTDHQKYNDPRDIQNLSDIFSYQNTSDTSLSDDYMTMIKFLWLKSGLRGHYSELANMKIVPIHEIEKLSDSTTIHQVPSPVLDKLDIKPMKIIGEKMAKSKVEEHDHLEHKSGKIIKPHAEPVSVKTKDSKASPIKRANTLDQKIRNKYEIYAEISVTSLDDIDDDLEYILENVGPLKLDEEIKFNPTKLLTTMKRKAFKFPEQKYPKASKGKTKTGPTQDIEPALDNIQEGSFTISHPVLKHPISDEGGYVYTINPYQYSNIQCDCGNFKVIIKTPSEEEIDLRDYKISYTKSRFILTLPLPPHIVEANRKDKLHFIRQVKQKVQKIFSRKSIKKSVECNTCESKYINETRSTMLPSKYNESHVSCNNETLEHSKSLICRKNKSNLSNKKLSISSTKSTGCLCDTFSRNKDIISSSSKSVIPIRKRNICLQISKKNTDSRQNEIYVDQSTNFDSDVNFNIEHYILGKLVEKHKKKVSLGQISTKTFKSDVNKTRPLKEKCHIKKINYDDTQNLKSLNNSGSKHYKLKYLDGKYRRHFKSQYRAENTCRSYSDQDTSFTRNTENETGYDKENLCLLYSLENPNKFDYKIDSIENKSTTDEMPGFIYYIQQQNQVNGDKIIDANTSFDKNFVTEENNNPSLMLVPQYQFSQGSFSLDKNIWSNLVHYFNKDDVSKKDMFIIPNQNSSNSFTSKFISSLDTLSQESFSKNKIININSDSVCWISDECESCTTVESLTSQQSFCKSENVDSSRFLDDYVFNTNQNIL